MGNLATNKTQMSTGLAILPNHVSDSIDALTGAQQFDDVTLEQRNIVARGLSIANIHPNKTRAVNIISRSQYGRVAHASGNNYDLDYTNPFSILWAGKIVEFPESGTAVNLTGKGSTATGGYAINLYNSGSAIIVRFILKSNVTITASKTLDSSYLNKTISIFGFNDGAYIYLYVNGILCEKTSISTLTTSIKNTLDYSLIDSNSISGTLSTSAKFITERCVPFNYALSASEISVINNFGRPDKAILPDYMKWGSNTDINSGYDFTSGWTAIGGATIVSSSKFTTISSGGISKNLLSLGKKYKIKIVIKNSQILYLRNGANAEGIITIPINANFTEYNFLFTQYGPNIYLRTDYAGEFEITTFAISQIGALADYNPSGILQTLGATATTTVTAGNYYETTVEITSAEALLVGANDVKVGTQFVAKESTTLSGTGRVKPIITTLWKDSSTNALNATITGSPNVIETQVEDVMYKSALDDRSRVDEWVNQITSTPTFTVDPGWINDFITVRNKSANALTFALGVSGGDKSVIADTVVPAGAVMAIRCISPMTINLEAIRTLWVTASGTALNYDTKQVRRRVA